MTTSIFSSGPCITNWPLFVDVFAWERSTHATSWCKNVGKSIVYFYAEIPCSICQAHFQWNTCIKLRTFFYYTFYLILEFYSIKMRTNFEIEYVKIPYWSTARYYDRTFMHVNFYMQNLKPVFDVITKCRPDNRQKLMYMDRPIRW